MRQCIIKNILIINILFVLDSENKVVTDNADITNELNTFFAIVGKTTTKKIKTNHKNQ